MWGDDRAKFSRFIRFCLFYKFLEPVFIEVQGVLSHCAGCFDLKAAQLGQQVYKLVLRKTSIIEVPLPLTINHEVTIHVEFTPRAKIQRIPCRDTHFL